MRMQLNGLIASDGKSKPRKIQLDGADNPIQLSKNSTEAGMRQPYRNHPICHGKIEAP